jgi:hypothetical protein
MITIEQIRKAFGDDRTPYQINKNVDCGFLVISVLRERIPYEKCKRILQGAEHDILYLCDIDEAIDYLSEEDLLILADCNVRLDEDSNSFALFV